MTSRWIAALILTCATALAAFAQSPMDADAFEAYVTGKTLSYARNGEIYGTEEYLPDRRVRWQFTQDLCRYGSWHQEGTAICFVYEAETTKHCWVFHKGAAGLSALHLGDPPSAALSEVQPSQTGLACPAPGLGV